MQEACGLWHVMYLEAEQQGCQRRQAFLGGANVDQSHAGPDHAVGANRSLKPVWHRLRLRS